MSIYSEAIDFGLSAIEATAGELITYRNGETDLTEVVAIAEDKSEQKAEVGGSRVTSTTRTQAFLIRPKHLAIDDVAFRPEPRHLIRRSDGQWYRVQNPDGGPVWEWGEGQRIHYRVFAVEINEPA
jgi:hypothetical protein